MRLSDAIRLGAMLRPQAFGVGFDGIGTCAVGAAAEACGHRFTTVLDEEYSPEIYDALLQMGLSGIQQSRCPVCGVECGVTSTATIPHLNDDHHWTRGQIADWVEAIEQRHAQPADVPVAVETAT